MKLTETDLRQHIAQRHSPLVMHKGCHLLDTEQMLASGVLTGPHRTRRHLTVSQLQRFARRVINFLERQ